MIQSKAFSTIHSFTFLWSNPKPSQQFTASLSCDPIQSFAKINSLTFLWSNPIHRFMVHISFQSTASLSFDSNQNLSHQSTASRFKFLFAFLNNQQLHGSSIHSFTFVWFKPKPFLTMHSFTIHSSHKSFSTIYLNNLSQQSIKHSTASSSFGPI